MKTGEKIGWRPVFRRLPWLLLLPLGIFLPRIAKAHADWIETVYAASVYPAIKDAVSSLTSLVPVSVAECALYALCIGVPLLLVKRIVQLIRRSIALPKLVNTLLSLGIAAGILWNLFYGMWGLNYFRAPLSERMGLTVKAQSVEALETLTTSLAEAAARARALCQEDENGVFVLPGDGRAASCFSELIPAYAALSEKQPALSGKVTSAKPVEWSEGLSWMGIAGVYIGFTAEPNVNVHQPPLLLPQGAAHEMAHQLGIASENEAEFCGILACLGAKEPALVYSGLMNALMTCTKALHSADAERYAAVRERYSDAMLRDLADYNAYWARYEGPVEARATAVNDSYLKHNAQESGVKSYGESVDLLLSLNEAENILDYITIF